MEYGLMGLVVLVVLAVLVTVVVVKRRAKKDRAIGSASGMPATAAQPESSAPTLPERIVIGENEQSPVLAIELSDDLASYQRATSVGPSGGISRLSAVLQAVPSLLVAKEAAGKKLMEVVVNGSLARASDGNGLRAFAMGSKGIAEHARLFEVNRLQSLISAAAVWQVASVLVAQKHLADINAKLENIAKGIERISAYLTQQRRARIHAAHSYLRQVSAAIGAGELAPSVRSEIESIERDLLEIQHHLEEEFRDRSSEKVADNDTVGTEDLTNNLLRKADELGARAADITLCVQTRVAAWHVLSLCPGEPMLKKARREAIEASFQRVRELPPLIGINLVFESDSIKSFWNRQSTLDERRSKVQARADKRGGLFRADVEAGARSLETSNAMLLEHDKPMRLFVEVENGQILDVREPVALAA